MKVQNQKKSTFEKNEQQQNQEDFTEDGASFVEPCRQTYQMRKVFKCEKPYQQNHGQGGNQE